MNRGEPCVRCEKNPTFYIKRGLCRTCYCGLRKRGELDLYPEGPLVPKNKFLEVHPGIEVDLAELLSEDKCTLAGVGRKHGITRERVRQIFELVYGFKYTAAYKRRLAAQHDAKRLAKIARKDPRVKTSEYKPDSLQHKGARSEEKVLEICSLLGYQVEPYIPDHSIDLVINGYLVEVKSAHTTTRTSPDNHTPQYHFRVINSQRKADFIICHAVPVNRFFVIPIEEYPKNNHLYIPVKKRMEWDTPYCHRVVESKYYQFLEAWHLLKPRQEPVVFHQGSLATQAAI